MNQPKKPSQLFSCAFDILKDDFSSPPSNSHSRKRRWENETNAVKKKKRVTSSMQQNQHQKATVDSDTWIEKHTPQTKDELAVHKKKVLEVEDWLTDSLKKSDTNQGACILLLTGPPGVGKTATVFALSKDLKLELKEWTSASQNAPQHDWNSEEYDSTNTFPEFAYENQVTTFTNFLIRANKYPPLFTSFRGRIVLVEEFPNTFFKNTNTFHNLLRRFHRVGRCPLIFIISDCTKGESAELSLFPKSIQNELCIKNISFNPVAPTMLLKVLNKINLNPKSSLQKKLTKSELDSIACDCMGDIRNAINTMQFLCVPTSNKAVSSVKNPIPSKGKKLLSAKSVDDRNDSSGNRDTSLFLFHALGKILYCKRDKDKLVEECSLPPHLNRFSRAPLLADPEDVFKKTSISEEGFILFLQQNYLSFTEDIKVAAECSAWLSDSEALTVEWSERHAMNSYAASLATRGLMFNLTQSSSGSRWRPFHKPQYFSSTKDTRSLSQSVKYAFKGQQLSLRELQVDFIPYVSKITSSFQNNEMRQLAKQLGVLKLQSNIRNETLCEKEMCEISLNDHENQYIKTDGISNEEECLTESLKKDMPEEEEFVIEECDI